MSHTLPATVPPRNHRQGDAGLHIPPCQPSSFKLGRPADACACGCSIRVLGNPSSRTPNPAGRRTCFPSTLPIVGNISHP
jgi:hypothetical protein